ncbi:uncharacterized protein [Apostichopus japonicus]|uniref:uncharacterized protein n=1 Tax=Stichopus japonicus TaxID=307972 RepID=UPI003AB8D817
MFSRMLSAFNLDNNQLKRQVHVRMLVLTAPKQRQKMRGCHISFLLVLRLITGVGCNNEFCMDLPYGFQSKLITIGSNTEIHCDIRDSCTSGVWRITLESNGTSYELSSGNCSACGDYFTVFNNKTSNSLIIENFNSELSGMYTCVSDSCSNGDKASPTRCFNVTGVARELRQCRLRLSYLQENGTSSIFTNGSSKVSVQTGARLNFTCIDGSKVRIKCGDNAIDKTDNIIVNISHNNCRIRCKKSFDGDAQCKTDLYLEVKNRIATTRLVAGFETTTGSSLMDKQTVKSANGPLIIISVFLAIFVFTTIVLGRYIIKSRGGRHDDVGNLPRACEPQYAVVMMH